VRGRKPKPVEVKRRYLPAAKTAWRQIVPRLAEVGMLDTVDAPALEALCVNVGLMRRAAAEMAKAPATVSGSHGKVKRNPLVDEFQIAQGAGQGGR